MKRPPFWLVPLTLIATLGLWLTRAPDVVRADAAQEPATPRYAITGARWLKLDESGQPRFRAQAVEIDFHDDGSARLDTLNVDALGGLHSPWRFNAPRGAMAAGQKRLRLDGPITGEVQLAADEWAQLNAERLWLDYDLRQITSDRPLKIASARRQAQARGLRADFSGERIELRGDVEARYAPG